MPYTDARDAVFDTLYEIAIHDKDVILLMADTGAQKLEDFKQNIPEQFYNVGIAEQNMISVAAGLALVGKKVFCYGISNFVTLCCLEQIKNDLCNMSLPVTILASGTGYMYPTDGPSHHFTENLSILRTLSNLTLWSPSDCTMLAGLVERAYLYQGIFGPSCIFFDRDFTLDIYDISIMNQTEKTFSTGLSCFHRDTNNKFLIIATGVMVSRAFEVADILAKQGYSAEVLDLYRISPVPEKLLCDEIKQVEHVVTLEENTVKGGLGSLVLETMAMNEIVKPVKLFGLIDPLQPYAWSREQLRKFNGLDVQSICQTILGWI